MRNILSYSEYINKINEAASDIVYHFTSVIGLYGILKDNKFNLKEDYDDVADKDYYYMSLSRTSTFETGYAQIKSNVKVRIQLDGRKLNHKYKIRAFNDEEYSIKEPNNYLSDKVDSFEYEDRLYTSKKHIDNAYTYITKIDIVEPNLEIHGELIEFIENVCKENGISLNIITLSEEEFINRVTKNKIKLDRVPEKLLTMEFFEKLVNKSYGNIYIILFYYHTYSRFEKLIGEDGILKLLKLAYNKNNKIIDEINASKLHSSYISKDLINKLKKDIATV